LLSLFLNHTKIENMWEHTGIIKPRQADVLSLWFSRSKISMIVVTFLCIRGYYLD